MLPDAPRRRRFHLKKIRIRLNARYILNLVGLDGNTPVSMLVYPVVDNNGNDKVMSVTCRDVMGLPPSLHINIRASSPAPQHARRNAKRYRPWCWSWSV